MSAANYKRVGKRARGGQTRALVAATRYGGMSTQASRTAAAARAIGRAYNIPVAPRYQAIRRNDDPKGVDISNLATQIGAPLLASTTTNTGVAVLNCVQPGNGSWNRAGRKIKMQSVRIKGAVEMLSDNNGGAAACRGGVVRLVVVYDKNVSGTPAAIPIYNVIFGTTDQLGNEVGLPFDNLRWDNTGRFRVIRDMMLTLDPIAIPGPAEEGAVRKVWFDEYIDLKGLETIYSGQSNPCTIADISSGALYLFARVDVATTNSAAALIAESTSRLRFSNA